jgi:hypothetical protein
MLGALVLSTLALAALSRADSEECRPFFIYVDEFQSFTTLMLASMLPELRKYGVGMTFANQHLRQLEPEIRSTVLGNAGTLISFRVGAEDAPYMAMAGEFQSKFNVDDVLSLPNWSVYLRLMINGVPSNRSAHRQLQGMFCRALTRQTHNLRGVNKAEVKFFVGAICS